MAEPPKQKQWVKSVTKPQSAQSDPARDKEIRELVDAMLDEPVTTIRHQGKLLFTGDKPHWEETEHFTASLLDTLQQGAQLVGAKRKNIKVSDFAQFGVLTPEGMVLDGAAGSKATYFPRQAMDSAVADTMAELTKGQKVPFCVTFNTQEIPRVKETLKEFFKTENGAAPILAFLLLLAGQQEIPEGSEYDRLRNLKSFLENDVDFIKVHCPGNAKLEDDLNRKLKQQHALCIAISLYLAEFNNVNEIESLVLAPLIGGIMGTGVALGVNAIHLKSALEQGAIFGGLLAVADAGDNFAGAIPEIVAGKRNGKKTRKLVREYGVNAVGGAASGAIFDILGGEIFAQGGEVWEITGAAIIALMTSLGFANNAKSRQDDHVQAYRELIRDKRLPAPDAIRALEREKAEIEKSHASDKADRFRAIEKQIDKETRDYSKAMGMLETVAGKTTTRANFAMLGTPAYAFIPPGLHFALVPLQLAMLAGSETYNLAAINAVSMLQKAFGHGYDDRLKKKLAAGEDISLLDLPKSRGAMTAQRLSYALGYVGQAPVTAVQSAKKFAERVIKNTDNDTPRSKE